MAVPKRKVSQSRRNKRRAHDGVRRMTLVENKTTGALHRPHHVSHEDGYYNGRQITTDKVNP